MTTEKGRKKVEVYDINNEGLFWSLTLTSSALGFFAHGEFSKTYTVSGFKSEMNRSIHSLILYPEKTATRQSEKGKEIFRDIASGEWSLRRRRICMTGFRKVLTTKSGLNCEGSK